MRATAKPEPYKWAFRTRFRRHGFGWKSQPAIQRIKEAVSEIKTVARRDALLAAEGAVSFLERLSPALEHVDSSSGAIGTAVNGAIADLVPIIASAPADTKLRGAWLERLFDAHAADEIPYIERLADHWGELCASQAMASAWGDRLDGVTRMAIGPDKKLVLACAALDSTSEAAEWVAGIRHAYRRFPAFQAELARPGSR
jgi:hypothetical protein